MTFLERELFRLACYKLQRPKYSYFLVVSRHVKKSVQYIKEWRSFLLFIRHKTQDIFLINFFYTQYTNMKKHKRRMCPKEINILICFRMSNNSENPSLDTSQTSLLCHWLILPSVHPSFDTEQSNESMSQRLSETVRVMGGPPAV
jgi:hypothetical protein